MGYWGVRSYENDDADDALYEGFDQVHGAVYEELMDDGNPLSLEQVQKRLGDDRTLAAAVAALEELVEAKLDGEPAAWDEAAKLAFAGVVVLHAELGVAIPEPWRVRAIDWLENEELDWDEETKRRLRREKEIALLRRAGPDTPGPSQAP